MALYYTFIFNSFRLRIFLTRELSKRVSLARLAVKILLSVSILIGRILLSSNPCLRTIRKPSSYFDSASSPAMFTIGYSCAFGVSESFQNLSLSVSGLQTFPCCRRIVPSRQSRHKNVSCPLPSWAPSIRGNGPHYNPPRLPSFPLPSYVLRNGWPGAAHRFP